MIEEKCLIDRKISLCILLEIDRWLIMNRVYQRKTDIQDYNASLRCIDRVEQEFSMNSFEFHMNS